MANNVNVELFPLNKQDGQEQIQNNLMMPHWVETIRALQTQSSICVIWMKDDTQQALRTYKKRMYNVACICQDEPDPAPTLFLTPAPTPTLAAAHAPFLASVNCDGDGN